MGDVTKSSGRRVGVVLLLLSVSSYIIFSTSSSFATSYSATDHMWFKMQQLFPYRQMTESENEIAVSGDDARDVLLKQYPELDRYLQKVIDHIESLKITRAPSVAALSSKYDPNSPPQVPDEGIAFDVWLDQPNLPLEFKPYADTKYMQPYKLVLNQHVRLEVAMKRGKIIVSNVEGLAVFVRIPLLPDGFYPRSVTLDTKREVVTMHAGAIGNWVEIVARADVKTRKFDGVDWFSTLLKNWYYVLGWTCFKLL